jgi:hypothetical protein
MVGYVMDGRTKNAMKSVLARIEREKKNLGYAGGEWEKSAFIPELEHVRQTRHLFVNPTKREFTFQHVLLAVTVA